MSDTSKKIFFKYTEKNERILDQLIASKEFMGKDVNFTLEKVIDPDTYGATIRILKSITKVKSDEQTKVHYMKQNTFSLCQNNGRPHAFKRRNTCCPAY